MILNGCCAIFSLPSISLSNDFQLPFTSFDFLFYPLAGYYLGTKLPMEKIRVRELLGCIAVILLGTGFTSILVYAEGYYLGFTQNYITLFTYSTTMAVFVLVRYAISNVTIPNWLSRWIIRISNVAIGIYLLEPIIGHYLFDPFHRGMPWTQAAVTGRSLLWCLLCMILCGGLTHLLRFIPGVKKYL